MNATKFDLFLTIFSLLVNRKNHFCEPRLDTLQDRLKKHHGIEIGRRWLFQCLKDLERKGYIERERRWVRLGGCRVRCISSRITITEKGIQYLIRFCVEGAEKLR